MGDGKVSDSVMEKRSEDKIYGRLGGVLAFVLPVLVMFAVFIIDGIYPFGDRCFLSTDLYHQYLAFFSELMRSVKGGAGISYTWNVGVGSNFLALYVYYLASPFHWLGLLVPSSHYIEFLTYLVVGKIGLCGLSAYHYFSRRSCACMRGWCAALFFSLGYALSGFMAAYNWNIMWLDCVILFPLVIMGLERLVEEGKSALYCLTLALSIFTNYYISIMICIFLVLYFVYLFLTGCGRGMRKNLAAVRDFAVYSLLAGGMAAVLLIPEVCAILATDFGSVEFPDKVESYFSVLEMLMRHCVAVSVEKGLDHWPNIYCGAAVFLCVPLFALNEKIPARRRFGMLALSGVMLLSFSTSVLDFIWHGLNYPDSLPARQSFIYIFLMLCMCLDGVNYLDFNVKEQKHRIIKVYLGVAAAMLFVEQFAEHEDIYDGVEWLTLLFVTIYAAVLYQMYLRGKAWQKQLFAWIAVAVMVCETSINTGVTSVANVSRSGYLENLEDYSELATLIMEQDKDFYRFDKFKRKTKNDGTLLGYPTASVFSSTMNSAVMDLYERLGMRHSKVYYDYDGSTAFTSALLNVKYVFGENPQFANDIFTPEESLGTVSVYRAKTLPFGYVAPEGYDLPEGYKNSGLRLQNQMVYDLGIQGTLFEKCTVRSDGGDNVRFTAEKDGIYYAILTASGTKKVKLLGTTPDELEWNDTKKGSVLYLGNVSAGGKVTITNNDSDDDTKKVSADVYRLDEEVLREALDVLSAQHLEDVKYDSTHLSGRLSLREEGRLILSVPCEKGWEVVLNGEPVEPEVFGGTFMAFDLQPGEYELSMHYVPYGKYAGIIVSVVSVIIFAVICLVRRKREH